MAITKFSVSAYTADGVTTDYLITWDYLDDDHIAVFVDGTPNYDPTSTYKFDLINSTTVRVTDEFDNPVPTGLEIEIRRETPIANRTVTFVDGSSLLAEDLNKNSDYLLFTMQETLDTVDQTVRDGALEIQTATGLIRDETQVLRDETEALKDTTGTYLATVQSDATDADNHRIAAAASQTAAAGSATNAATSATNAASSATASANSAAGALASQQASAASQAAALASEQAAATAETGAVAAINNATVIRDNAAASAAAAAASEASVAADAASALSSKNDAATSASNALASQNAAYASAGSASTSASNSATSEANAATSETNAAASANAAGTSETNAAASALAASTSETNAATSEANAASSETNAAASASAAISAKAASETARDQALSALDSFDDRYLGQKASDPTVDNDGNPLVTGALYYNTTTSVMNVYEGSGWVAAYASLSGALLVSNNLSDLSDAAVARSNLGLATVAASGDYNNLINTPAPFDPGTLATVATTGAYSDLSGLPTLGTAAATNSTAYATAAQGSLADSAVQPNDNPSFGSITVTGTVDGRDVAADGTKLDGIEAGATADQTITAGSGLTGGGTGDVTISHADTSSQGSVDNSGATVIQDVTLDTYGHVTALGSTTLTAAAVGAPSTDGTGASGTWGINVTGSAASATNANSINGTSTVFGLSGSGLSSGHAGKAGPEVTSTGGGGAVLSMHRPGAYAINMGLDSDNVFRIGGWSASANRLQMDMSGNLTMAGNVTAYSDIRLKEDLEVITGALDKVKSLTGYTYTRIDSGERHTGVIAQDVEKVLPEAVNNDGEHLSVAYGNMVGLLIEAIKEQQAQIEDLKARLEV